MRFSGAGGVRNLIANRVLTPPSPGIDAALLVARITTVLALFPNGLRKIATFEQTAAGMGGETQMIDGRVFPDQAPLVTFPLPEFFLGASLLLDLLGALLVVIGWRTRAVATVLAGYVMLAMAIFHSDIRHAEDAIHLLRNLPFVAALLMLAAVGGGRWSIDGLRARV